MEKTPVHFVAPYLLNPTHPVVINVIGAGGTGSHVVSALARMNYALLALDHPGLQVFLYDNDQVTDTNPSRSLFPTSAVGTYKSAELITRMNMAYGTNWKAVTSQYKFTGLTKYPNEGAANITVSCVDSVPARFDIAKALKKTARPRIYGQTIKPYYWIDAGNSRYSGQVILSTVADIPQPQSERFIPVGTLPLVTEQFRAMLESAAATDDSPTCSMAEALSQQDLLINPIIAQYTVSLLWKIFRNAITIHRGVFLNLQDYSTMPLLVQAPAPELAQAA